MFPILRFWDRLSRGVKGAALAAFLAIPVLGQTADSADSLSGSAEDDLVKFEAPVSPAENNDSIAVAADSVTDTAPVAVEKAAQAAVEKTALKSVLYLGGGNSSPWFFLGVLYAIEEYKVPVDSIVGTSWGAWIGSLWSRGVPVDEIQRILLDPALVSYVGKDLSQEKMTSGVGKEMELSPSGIGSLRQRFVLSVDSAGNVRRNLRSLDLDSVYVDRLLARLRFQESLYRQDERHQIPFAVLGCDGLLPDRSVETVIGSLPLWKLPAGNKASQVSGELCPHYATPAEDRSDELSLIVVAEPLRGEIKGDERYRLLVQQASAQLANQPGVIIRAHSVLDTSRNVWIQAGFSALERKLGEIRSQLNRSTDYSIQKRPVALPWFKFTPSFEGVPSEIHTSIKSYWNDADTGLVALANFARELARNPAYDSLVVSMLSNGELLVGAANHPAFDVALGGFGSNVIGPNAYFEASVNFVDQMEIQLALKGFWGSSSFGFQPRLDISRLWDKHWSVHFGYDFLKLVPLKTFNNDVDRLVRIVEEDRNDFFLSLVYQIDGSQRAYADFLFGHRTFELDHYIFGKKPIRTYPVSPMLHYSYSRGDDSRWFSREGIALDVGAGLESIGFDFGVNDVIPIYWKLEADARYTHSPRPYLTFSIGAAAGIERYHEDGYGYVVPVSFGYEPLDVVYRMHGNVTPWLNEWYCAELSSHEYALLRASGSIHNRYFGFWLFGAYFHDFENSPYAVLSQNKFIVEPALYFAYKSIKVYAGLNRIVDKDSFGDLKRFKDYTYFVRIGEYKF